MIDKNENICKSTRIKPKLMMSNMSCWDINNSICRKNSIYIYIICCNKAQQNTLNPNNLYAKIKLLQLCNPNNNITPTSLNHRQALNPTSL